MSLYNCSTCVGSGWSGYNETQCYRISATTATAPITPFTVYTAQNDVFSGLGARFYKPNGFNLNGTSTDGTFAATSTTTSVWDSNGVSTQGPLNRSGLWASTGSAAPPYNTWLGFSVCLTTF